MAGSCKGRGTLVVAAFSCVISLAIATPAVGGFDDAQAYSAISVDLTGPPGRISKGETATFTATVSNQGTVGAPGLELELNTYRPDGHRPVQNPYVSVHPSQGTCESSNFSSSFGEYHGQTCALGDLAPGATAQVTVSVQINESMDHNAYEVRSAAEAQVTTLVDSPPEVSGSRKIKVRGLPDGCAANDFTLRAKAKGAKKVVATLRGPLNAEAKPLDGGFSDSRKLGAAKGAKLKAAIPAAKLRSAYYEIKLAAKYASKPKQKGSVLFQACP